MGISKPAAAITQRWKHNGIFKAFYDKAEMPIGSDASVDLGIGKSPTVWKVSLEGTGDNPTRTECFANNHIRIGYDSYGKTPPDSYEKGDNGRNIKYTCLEIDKECEPK